MRVMDRSAGLAAVSVAMLLAVIDGCPGARAQAPSVSQTRPRMADEADQIRRERLRYLALASRYCSDDIEGSLADLSQWNWRTFMDVYDHMRRFRGWQLHEVECAAMMHTDEALRESSWSPTFVAHLDSARRLLHLLDGEPLDQSFHRGWYVAVAALIHGELRLVELEEHLQDGLRLFPDDVGILLAFGMMREAVASPHLAAVVAAFPRRTEFRVGTFPGAKDARNQAANHYRRVLELDPEAFEARLRLGRLLAERGEVAEASRQLKVVREGSTDTRVRYLASLFAGRLFEANGRLAEAADAYREAVGLYPHCQSAWLALSHATHQQGRREETERLVRQALEGATEDCSDPWGLYDFGLAPQAAVMFDALREKVRSR